MFKACANARTPTLRVFEVADDLAVDDPETLRSVS
jgi:hypothetical protein